MTIFVFDKTEKAREEITNRSTQLPNRLRTLLVMVDGKTPAEELLKKVAGLGLDEQSLAMLEKDGYVQALSIPNSIVADLEQAQPEPIIATHTQQPVTTEVSDVSVIERPVVSEAERRQAVHRFYNQTIRENLGFRGVAMQLKVERASTLEDYLALSQPYLEAVLKAKGDVVAKALRDRLYQLLG